MTRNVNGTSYPVRFMARQSTQRANTGAFDARCPEKSLDAIAAPRFGLMRIAFAPQVGRLASAKNAVAEGRAIIITC